MKITTEQLVEIFKEEGLALFEREIIPLFVDKNTDYGNDQIIDFGDFGIFVRSNDKHNRLKNYYSKGFRGFKVEDEGIDDSWRDLAVYCLLAVLYRRGAFGNK